MKDWEGWKLLLPVALAFLIEGFAWWLLHERGLMFAVPTVAIAYGYWVWWVSKEFAEKDFGTEGGYTFNAQSLDGKPADPTVGIQADRADNIALPPDDRKMAEKGAAAAIVSAVSAITTGASALEDRAALMNEIGRVTGWSRANPDRRFDRLSSILDRLQGRINDEYLDVATRTGWLMTAQAFLLAAFVQAINTENLTDGARILFAVGVAATGVVTSLVLTSAIFFGHALIERLKPERDKVEIELNTFGVPRAAVPKDKSVHHWGHFATKTLPSFAFAVWSSLVIFALFGDARVPAPVKPITIQADFAFGQSLKELEASPPFAVGAVRFDEQKKGCPPAAETELLAKEWLERVVRAWEGRTRPTASDSLVVIGAADRQPLDEALRKQFDSNMGVARARAETVKRMLDAATKDKPALHRLSESRVHVQITGPGYTPPGSAHVECRSKGEAEDRRIRVWLSGSQ